MVLTYTFTHLIYLETYYNDFEYLYLIITTSNDLSEVICSSLDIHFFIEYICDQHLCEQNKTMQTFSYFIQ